MESESLYRADVIRDGLLSKIREKLAAVFSQELDASDAQQWVLLPDGGAGPAASLLPKSTGLRQDPAFGTKRAARELAGVKARAPGAAAGKGHVLPPEHNRAWASGHPDEPGMIMRLHRGFRAELKEALLETLSPGRR